jgi:predicted membrane-bound spermidine synthase
VAAIVSGLIPVVSRPILDASLQAFDDVAVGAFYGSLVATLVLIGIPITLLGFVSPFAIRLLVPEVAAAGNTAGNLYALSTVGSIVGSFLPVILLIPFVGTARTFVVLALLLLIPSVVALAFVRRYVRAAAMTALGVGLVAITIVGAQQNVRAADRGNLVYETESQYHYIQVLEEDGAYLLSLNDGHAVHSIYSPDELLTQGPWDYFMVGPLVNQGAGADSVDNALLIGLAGGTVARQLTAAYGPIPIDGVELDAEVARVGREYFHMEEEAPGLEVHIEDGRYFLKTFDTTYDLIGVDAYRQPYSPFQLTTREFFTEVADHLNPGGVVVVNVGRTATDYRLVDAIASTMNAVFPSVYAIEADRYYNTILIGSTDPNGIENFTANTQRLEAGSPLRTPAELSLATGNLRLIDPGGEVFTDDHAPVELVVDLMILDEAMARQDEEDQ